MFKSTLFKSFVLSSVLLVSANASAELIATDWKAEGDSLSALDTTTGIEWLKLSSTGGHAISSFPKADFDGWRLPTHAEVSGLFAEYMSAFTQGLNGSQKINTAEQQAQADYMLSYLTDGSYFRAWYYDDTGTVRINNVNYKTSSTRGYVATYSGSYNSYENAGYHNVGVYLVSDGGTTLSSISNPALNANNSNAPINQESSSDPISVPVPATLGLFGLMGLMFARRKKA